MNAEHPGPSGQRTAPGAPAVRWEVDFDQAPFLVIWETTQACDLACRHCRAHAMPGPFPGELSVEEGEDLVDQVAGMGTPLLVFSGGDPATRPDLFRLVCHAKARGLRVATIPAATDRLTPQLVRQLKECGLDQIAFSLDFPNAKLHDDFRGVPGAFDRTIEAIGWAREAGIPPQVNTTVFDESAPHLGEMARLVERLGIHFWEVFFLVPTGRATAMRNLDPETCERAFEVLRGAQNRGSYILKVTEAPQYRRYLAQHRDAERGRVRHGTGDGDETIPMARRGVNAGNGFLFISHRGEIYPSGFLPLPAGNIRRDPLDAVYRDSEVFRALRDPTRLSGRCGRCPYRAMCGGSRSRALALTGDFLGEDPWCAYEPATGTA